MQYGVAIWSRPSHTNKRLSALFSLSALRKWPFLKLRNAQSEMHPRCALIVKKRIINT